MTLARCWSYNDNVSASIVYDIVDRFISSRTKADIWLGIAMKPPSATLNVVIIEQTNTPFCTRRFKLDSWNLSTFYL